MIIPASNDSSFSLLKVIPISLVVLFPFHLLQAMKTMFPVKEMYSFERETMYSRYNVCLMDSLEEEKTFRNSHTENGKSHLHEIIL